MIWKKKVSKSGVLLFQLQAKVHGITGKECGFLPTPTVGCEEGGEQSSRVEQTKSGGFVLRKKNNPNMTYGAKLSDAMLYLEKKMYPTPTTQEIEHPNMELNNKGRRMTKDGKSSHSLNLADTVKMYPTPNTRDSRRGCNQKQLATEIDKENPKARKLGGKLNPEFVEFLMGYPMNWTKIEPRE